MEKVKTIIENINDIRDKFAEFNEVISIEDDISNNFKPTIITLIGLQSKYIVIQGNFKDVFLVNSFLIDKHLFYYSTHINISNIEELIDNIDKITKLLNDKSIENRLTLLYNQAKDFSNKEAVELPKYVSDTLTNYNIKDINKLNIADYKVLKYLGKIADILEMTHSSKSISKFNYISYNIFISGLLENHLKELIFKVKLHGDIISNITLLYGIDSAEFFKAFIKLSRAKQHNLKMLIEDVV